MLELSKDYTLMYHNAVYQGTLYLEKHPSIKTLVIGVSGGIDSALTAYLAKRTCASVGRDIKVIGVSIPIGSNKPDEIERAKMIGSSLCDSFHEIDLTEQWKSINEFLNNQFLPLPENEIDVKIRRGNSKARLRMMYLYNLAHTLNGMVLSTDNLTEYYLGFWTLHGDVGDFCFIQNLWKTEVYGLADWALERAKTLNLNGLKECIEAIPTDGLGVSNSDLDQLMPSVIEYCKTNDQSINYRHLYKIVDSILIELLSTPKREGYLISYDEGAVQSITDRCKNSQYKRENPYSIPRNKLLSK